jgi:hypothetical protein
VITLRGINIQMTKNSVKVAIYSVSRNRRKASLNPAFSSKSEIGTDVEGRADMARTLPEGDPRYATDLFTQNGWCRLPTRGRGRLRFMVALAAPLPGTTYAGTRWTTLGYPEKVRSQVLSLRQLSQSPVFSG